MKIKPKAFLLLAAFAAIALVSNSCTKKAAAGDKRVIRIGFLGKSLSNDVFQAAENGARTAAKELSEKYGVEIEIESRTPNDEDVTKQVEGIEALTRGGVDGIAISCSEYNTLTPAIDKAISKGVPVICFDSDAPTSKRFAFYGTDDEDCGARTVDELAKAMNEEGTIAILGGNQSAPNLQKRVAGAKQALTKYPKMKLNEPNGVFYHADTPEKAAEAVAQAQNANPGIQGWAFIGGWPLFTADALKWPAGSIKVASVDGLPAQLGYLKSGHVEVLLAQDCYGWGYKSVDMLLQKILKNETPATPKVIDPLTKVTKENVDEYGKNWAKWLAK